MTETINVGGYTFHVTGAGHGSDKPVAVEVGGLIESFDTHAEALLWILTVVRAP